jgi:hypothetical protein
MRQSQLQRHFHETFCSWKSIQACVVLSSAFSTALRMALSPPAIIPFTKSNGTPKVGGHSEASTIPNRPEVPAPI